MLDWRLAGCARNSQIALPPALGSSGVGKTTPLGLYRWTPYLSADAVAGLIFGSLMMQKRKKGAKYL
jgi:hypothetical protein